jgi:hypothetical protein
MEILDAQIDIHLSPEEHEWELFIGNNASYYIPIWQKFRTQDTKVHIHLPAFFLNIHWLGYRKMYKFAITYVLLFNILPSFLFSLIGIGSYLEVQFMLLFAYPFFGLFGNWLYYNHAQKIISDIKRTHSNEASRKKAIQEAGQTNPTFPFILFFLAMSLNIFVPLLLDFFH